MKVNLVYLDHLLATCVLDELHVWADTYRTGDLEWIKTLSKKEGYTVFMREELRPPHSLEQFAHYKKIYRFYSISGADFEEGEVVALNRERMPSRFVPDWDGATRQNTVLVKLDDDIVYIDTRRIPSFIEYVRSTPEMLMVHANTVNDGVPAYYQAMQDPDLMKRMPDLAMYPYKIAHEDKGDDRMKRYLEVTEDGQFVQYGRAGPLWTSDDYAEKIHRYFVENPSRFVHGTGPSGERCIVFKGPKQHAGQGRLSITFWGARWDAMDTVAGIFSRKHIGGLGDEFLLTVAATREPGIQECILTDTVVAHLSFGEQEKQDKSWVQPVLELYERLAEKESAAFAGGSHGPL